jgi:hypothetical protein
MAALWRLVSSVALARRAFVKLMAGVAKAEAPARCVKKCRRDMPDGMSRDIVFSKGT